MAAPAITINNQKIPWSFIQLVRRYAGGDWDDTIDCFWKVKDKAGQNSIVRYIQSGLIDYSKGNKWLFRASKERENGHMESIRQWWIAIYAPQKKNPMMSVREIFAAIVSGAEK